MKIFDCFMFYDEEMLLEIRLNELNKFVDYFVIVESNYTHSGAIKDFVFNKKKYQKFSDKIIYVKVETQPNNILKISNEDNDDTKNRKYIMNALFREQYQRNQISIGLKNANPNDIIMLSDLDEIPDLRNFDFKKIDNKFVFFKQLNFYYKFNLYLKNFDWIGTRSCKYKYLLSPQWLRDIKAKNYPFWRLDILFSNIKTNKIFFKQNGGWHFSYLKNAEDIEKKLKNYLHHREYDLNPLGKNKINELIESYIPVYDLKVDMKKSKFDGKSSLVKLENNYLPDYLLENKDKYKKWFE